MNNKLRELADRWKRIAIADRRDFGDVQANRIESCADELLSILEAEGDADRIKADESAVPPEVDVWVEAKKEHKRRVATYNARVEYARAHELGQVSVDHEYQAMCAQQRAMHALEEPMFYALAYTHPPAQAAKVDADELIGAYDEAVRSQRASGFQPPAAQQAARACVEHNRNRLRTAILVAPTAEPVAQGEAPGTFNCPICGAGIVHYHSEREVCAWAAAQANRFLVSLGHPEIVMRTKEDDDRRTADFRKRVADVEEMSRDAGHSYQTEYARLAAQPRAVPDGWVLVPRNPTDAMLDAALKLQGDDAFLARAPAVMSAFVKIHKAMIAAAPSPGESA